MSESGNAPLNPDPPRAPGTPSVEDLDVGLPAVARETPAASDIQEEEEGATEPPD
ncbi:hypothetical protein FHS29_007042 [Saccharothrix tamanrassetensis]|uniref:Uncharacterized protein n=1 Tax=Saccharothrix tamanrassetensis TaxID=1051531 RepID=A0A841CWC0_9PSEU|nr:hypothetical protein [Saccharothrix tamanrassetensis]MBB5960418.1 hypothetical protein [Saccharothrix tamanrassetensis]